MSPTVSVRLYRERTGVHGDRELAIALSVVDSPYPPTRSFQPRRRALSPTRAGRYEQLLAEWELPVDGPALDLVALFGAGTPVVLEIGFGGGEGLIDMATARPHEAIIGAEVHTPGVANVLDSVAANQWRHVRVVAGDVLEFLHRVPSGSLSGVRVFFPDPWLKNKQRHRRLVRPDVVAQLVDRLRPGGTLHVATDIAEYAQQTQAVCGQVAELRGGVVPRPEWRPLTRFERRGLAAGRAATDLIYERIS